MRIRQQTHYPRLSHTHLFFALLLFLPTQLGLHTWPSFSRVLGRRIDYLSPTLFVTDILLFATLLLWLWEKLQTKNMVVSKKIITVSAVFIFFLGINIGFAQQQFPAILQALKYSELFLFAIYIIDTKPTLQQIGIPLAIAVVYSGVLGLAQLFLQHSVGGLLWFIGERNFSAYTYGIARSTIYGRLLIRPYATFPHPNVLSGFVVILFPLFFGVPMNKRWQQQLLDIALAFSILTISVAFSRSSWAVFSVVFIGALLLSRMHKMSVRMHNILIVGAGIGIITALLLPIFADRILDLFIQNNESVQQRQALIDAGIAMIQTHPLLGVGLANFIPQLTVHTTLAAIDFQLQPVHSVYLLLFAETGLVGLVGFLVLVSTAVVHALRKNTGALVLALCALLFLGLFDHYLLTLQQTQFLATLLIACAFI